MIKITHPPTAKLELVPQLEFSCIVGPAPAVTLGSSRDWVDVGKNRKTKTKTSSVQFCLVGKRYGSDDS